MRGLGIRLPATSGGRGRDRRPRAPVLIFSFSTPNHPVFVHALLWTERRSYPSPIPTLLANNQVLFFPCYNPAPHTSPGQRDGRFSTHSFHRTYSRSSLLGHPRKPNVRLARAFLLFSSNRGLADLLTRDPETGSASLIFAGVRLSPADRTGRLVAPLPLGLGLSFLVALGPGVQRFGSVGRIGAVFRCRPSGRLARRARPRRVGSFLLTPGPSAPPGIGLPICVYVGRPAGPGPTLSLSFTPLALSSW